MFFQISCDYYFEDLSKEQLVSMMAMYGLILNKFNSVPFFDDLLWQRMNKTFKNNKLKVLKEIENIGFLDCVANVNTVESVVVWGAGDIAKELVECADFFNHVDIDFFVDSNYLEIESFSNKNVLSPKVLKDNDSKIVISAALNFPSIMSDIEKLGIDKSRIVKGLII